MLMTFCVTDTLVISRKQSKHFLFNILFILLRSNMEKSLLQNSTVLLLLLVTFYVEASGEFD